MVVIVLATSCTYFAIKILYVLKILLQKHNYIFFTWLVADSFVTMALASSALLFTTAILPSHLFLSSHLATSSALRTALDSSPSEALASPPEEESSRGFSGRLT